MCISVCARMHLSVCVCVHARLPAHIKLVQFVRVKKTAVISGNVNHCTIKSPRLHPFPPLLNLLSIVLIVIADVFIFLSSSSSSSSQSFNGFEHCTHGILSVRSLRNIHCCLYNVSLLFIAFSSILSSFYFSLMVLFLK